MYNVGEITEAVERLIWRGPLENRGKSGEESLYVETPDVIPKSNPCPSANAKCTPHKEYILPRTQVRNNVGKQSEKEKELKED